MRMTPECRERMEEYVTRVLDFLEPGDLLLPAAAARELWCPILDGPCKSNGCMAWAPCGDETNGFCSLLPELVWVPREEIEMGGSA